MILVLTEKGSKFVKENEISDSEARITRVIEYEQKRMFVGSITGMDARSSDCLTSKSLNSALQSLFCAVQLISYTFG
ncbi:hypothetical protein VNO77_15846 [Canavalia gladiata]|uniref:Uncharacterized protein n=1 Tax=Canavalia gladiata TaxID=3824 RepID=A0AAN9M0N4_CANGL